MDRYGESAPGPALYAHFGLTPEHVVEAANALL
jgi:transketolase